MFFRSVAISLSILSGVVLSKQVKHVRVVWILFAYDTIRNSSPLNRRLNSFQKSFKRFTRRLLIKVAKNNENCFRWVLKYLFSIQIMKVSLRNLQLFEWKIYHIIVRLSWILKIPELSVAVNWTNREAFITAIMTWLKKHSCIQRGPCITILLQ